LSVRRYGLNFQVSKVLKVVGIISMGCRACAGLRRVLEERFEEQGYVLEFKTVVYEHDPETAETLCNEYGLDDIPSFWINGVVFRVGFEDDDVKAAIQC